MSVRIGSKFVCTVCGSEFIVTKAGKAELKCCGRPLEKSNK